MLLSVGVQLSQYGLFDLLVSAQLVQVFRTAAEVLALDKLGKVDVMDTDDHGGLTVLRVGQDHAFAHDRGRLVDGFQLFDGNVFASAQLRSGNVRVSERRVPP